MSTRERETLAMSGLECDPETAVIECPVELGGGAGPAQGGLDLAYNWTTCLDTSGGADLDTDGIVDACEYTVASSFAPLFNGSLADADSGAEPRWAVADVGDQRLRIFYLLAYHRDMGSSGVGAHYGDSEFVIVTVRYEYGKWRFQNATLSAHWQAWPWDSTSTPGADDFEYVDVYRGRPIVWVAKNKHANYSSRSRCNSGALGTDTCDGSTLAHGIGIIENDNVGNVDSRPGAQILINCVYTRYVYSSPYPGVECFWTNDRFKGWSGQTPDAGGYKHSLWFYNF